MQKATQATPGLFGSAGGCFGEGANYITSYLWLCFNVQLAYFHKEGGKMARMRTPSHLLCDRVFVQYKTGCDSAPISTNEERHLFNRLISAHPNTGSMRGITWAVFSDLGMKR